MGLSVLLLLFILVPLGELWLLFTIADLLGEGGGWTTFGLVILTGMFGASLARGQGVKVLRAIQTDLAQGRMPTDHVISGLLVLVGGALLVTPGVVTDLVGLFLMVPGDRHLLVPPLKRYFARRFQIQQLHTPFSPSTFAKDAEGVEVHDEPCDSA